LSVFDRIIFTYFIPCINGRERTLELYDFLSTSSTQKIIIAILYKGRSVIASFELISIISQKRFLPREEIVGASSFEASVSLRVSLSC
jgi:hypothetical protein